MRPWHLGNTTVRSPFRLRDGLSVLANSPLVGNIKGRENENAFARMLHEADIIKLNRLDADVSDMGRKWRVALSQLGFIFPEIPTRAEIPQDELGAPFTITPNGLRLIETDTVPGMQECFLRSLAAYYIPSVLESRYEYHTFSPLRHVLAVMLELEQRTGDSRLNFLEMGLYVQLTSANDPLARVVEQILTSRTERAGAANKRRFDQAALDAAALAHDYVANTFKDYADTNFRYLKATGLVQSAGRGIALVPEKHVFVEQLVAEDHLPESELSFLTCLCDGAVLPTDDRDTALLVLEDLVAQVNQRGEPFTLLGRAVDSPADIALIRHEAEELLAKLNEEQYAERQAHEWNEIVEYMELLINQRRRRRVNDDENPIGIPQMEYPAYFEWVLWRAFLAIDSLVNPPYESRRFKIDQDFLPVGTAPGNGPDLIFEFDDFVVVVEVTLMTNSRQEAAEGEPVRRHVANEVIRYANLNGKTVYGLFLANLIDSNTAETFRIGCWYDRDDERMRLDIVPMTLVQFKELFEAMFRSENVRVDEIRELLEICSRIRDQHHAPEWKSEIERTLRGRAEELNRTN